MKKTFYKKFWLFFVLVFAISACSLDNENDQEKEDIQVYFSRTNQQVDEIIVGLIDNTGKTIDIAVYSITRQSITDAIIRAHQRGVVVRMVVDESQAGGVGSRVASLETSGINLKRIVHTGSAQMHHKFAVIDDRITITGSFNWTTNAVMNNDENFVVITSARVAGEFQTEFERLWPLE